MDPAHGRPQNPRSNRHGARVVQMDASWECLRKVCNLSSASVLLVLEEVFKRRRPAAGTYSVLAAMGPGFLFGISSSQVELMGLDTLKTDIFVMGGGPAGLATAIALRQRGLSVVVADLARPPIDKACGEGLMPQTVAELKALGVTLGPSQAVPFRGIRFLGEGRVAESAFAEAYGLGVRRTTLHQALVERALEAGVQSLWGTRVKGINRGEAWLDSCKVQKPLDRRRRRAKVPGA
jgi:hypothetical protein